MPRLSSPRWQLVVHAVAASTFVAVATIAFLALPDRTDAIQPLPFLVVALLLAPANTACNAAEYAVTARYAGVRVGARDAVTIAVVASAANLLPLPGAALVRGTALRREGISTARATVLVLAVSATWLASAALVAGAVLAVGGDLAQGAVLVLGAAVGIAAAHRFAGARHRSGTGLTAALVGVELATVCIGALRVWLCVRGLGYDADAAQSVLLTLASMLATAAGIVPGGLGLREGLAAWLSPFASLSSAVGAASSATDRLLGLPALGGALIVIWGSPHRRRIMGERPADPTPAGEP